MSLAEKVDSIDWRAAGEQLDSAGYATLRKLLSTEQCEQISSYYSQDDLFRSTIDMNRYNFGRGEYRYFSYPLPPEVDSLRTSLYRQLAPIANGWYADLNSPQNWPESLSKFLELCKDSGQTRPTPLMLKYEASDYNRLHQDLYGELFFPLQVVILLSEPDHDFEGGELVLVEQRPRTQSRVSVVNLRRGDAAIFPVRERPYLGGKRPYRLQMRHGVSEISRGNRTTLGIIFHDAE
ncbi:MAG: 2OG-Fe(II) oxygenase [Gammaproteobacteria bacterium]